jgi:hypothetical protein
MDQIVQLNLTFTEARDLAVALTKLQDSPELRYITLFPTYHKSLQTILQLLQQSLDSKDSQSQSTDGDSLASSQDAVMPLSGAVTPVPNGGHLVM